MNRNRSAALGVLLVALGLLTAGGQAFTGGNTFAKSTQVVGQGAQTITGATAQSIDYVLDPTGATITGVSLRLVGDTSGHAVKLGFNGGAVATCSGAGAHDTGTNRTTYTCTANQAVATMVSFQLVVSEPGATTTTAAPTTTTTTEPEVTTTTAAPCGGHGELCGGGGGGGEIENPDPDPDLGPPVE